MDAQHLDAALDPGVRWEQRAGEPAMAMEMEETAKRQDTGLGPAQSMESKVQMDMSPTCKAAVRDVETNMMAAIRKDRMVTSFGIGGDGQPGSDALQIEPVGIGAIGRDRIDAQGGGVEIGMPDDPRLGR